MFNIATGKNMKNGHNVQKFAIQASENDLEIYVQDLETLAYPV